MYAPADLKIPGVGALNEHLSASLRDGESVAVILVSKPVVLVDVRGTHVALGDSERVRLWAGPNVQRHAQ